MPTFNVSPQILVGQGHSASSLAAFLVRPRCPGLLYPDRHVSLSGKVYFDGFPFVVLDWGRKYPAHGVANALSVCGLSRTVFYANVTIRIPDNDNRSTSRNYNGIAQYPAEWDYSLSAWQNFTITVANLEAI